ncbi:MAG: CotH kinase family protein [Bacteroidales bacterium]|jgi:hypothetical protein|nr:CotH kinase family protein [Bacteroidales bacterium]
MTHKNLKNSVKIILAVCCVASCREDPKEEPATPRAFNKIEASLPKITYLLGETPNFDDLTVKEVFTDGYKKINTTYQLQWNGDKFKAGTSVATITARNDTATIDIVTENKLVDTGLPVVYVETEGRQTIDSKDTYVNARMTIRDKGNIMSENALRIRGRGNATWSYPKKPYKVKLDSKTSLLGMGEDKDWALLANYCDKTLMRTDIAFKLSELLGFPWTPKARFVELVLNGEYMGNYQLVEAIKQDKNRVNIPKTGFIIERDGYYLQEPIWFTTNRGYGYSFKNPDTDDLTEDQINYIKYYMNEFEAVLSSASFNDPENGYAKYIHTESFARWFLFQQMIANMDTNPYFIKEDMTSASKLSMGPVWDFEWSLGIGWYEGSRPRPADYYVWHSEFYYNRLLQDAGFTAKLQQMWETCHSRVTQDILQHISDVQKEIMESQSLNFKRWDILNTRISVGGIPLGSFEKEVECDRQFFINHMNWLETALYNFN